MFGRAEPWGGGVDRCLRTGPRAGHRDFDLAHGRVTDHRLAGNLAGLDDERGGSTFTKAETRRRVGTFGNHGAGDLASKVDAHVHLPRGTLMHREQAVEARDTEDLGRRHVETLGEIVHASRTDPAGTVVQRMESGKKLVTPFTHGETARTGAKPGFGAIGPAPAFLGLPEHGIDRSYFLGRCDIGTKFEIHPLLPCHQDRRRMMVRVGAERFP